jgi:3-deoxy-manno-octulosonate cytidylyltransferase (CMP-KDO synthetase)
MVTPKLTRWQDALPDPRVRLRGRAPRAQEAAMQKAPFAAWLVVVPARLASERLPRKPLADLGGEPMIVRVRRNLAPLAEAGARVVVATDAPEVVAACEAAGFRAAMTSAAHPSGTDRTAEVLELESAGGAAPELVLNVQGDEPFVAVDDLMRLMRRLEGDARADLATLAFPTAEAALFADPNTVKIVAAEDGRAVYFSRAGVPHARGGAGGQPERFLVHVGVYAFRARRLRDFVALPPSPLERTEKLEQLRAVEAGWRIVLETAAHFERGIDTPQDLEAARARLRRSR